MNKEVGIVKEMSPFINDHDPITLESLQKYDPRSIVPIKIGEQFAGFYVMSIYRWIDEAKHKRIPILNPLLGTEMDTETITYICKLKKRWVHELYLEELDRRFPNDSSNRVQIFVNDPVNALTWTFRTRLDESVVRFARLLSDAFGYTSSYHLRFTYAGNGCYAVDTLAEMGIRNESTINSFWACTTSHLYTHVPSLLPTE